LKCLGHFPADVDVSAIYGNVTTTAVKSFQKYHKIAETGVVDDATRVELNKFATTPTPAPTPTPTPTPEPTPTTFIEKSGCTSPFNFVNYLALESESEEVRALQDLLQCLGYIPSTQASTAYYGSVTVDAVEAFQKYHNIDPLGVVGPATRQLLNQY
jgi:peptidoglycan hydrolase-like protein with peptidoglycan-binding domain